MRGWGTHLALLAVLGLQVGLWALGHRDDTELQSALRSDDPDERIAAHFLLLERGSVDTTYVEQTLVEQALSGSAAPREVEFASTTSVCKYAGAGKQYAALFDRLDEGEVDGAFWRSFVVLRRKIGGSIGGSSGRLKRRELDWWFDALAGRELPAEEVVEWIRANP